MDARQPAPPFTRPPDRHLIHNPNHQPPATAAAAAAATHAYPSYPPSTQPQPQPPQPGQHPLHMPYAASNDPYATSRRDPFLPQASHHVRQRSHGAVEGVSHVHAERNGNWGNTGTQYNGGFSWGAMASHLCVSQTSPHVRALGVGLCSRPQWHSSHGMAWLCALRRDMETRGPTGVGCQDSSRTATCVTCCRTRRPGVPPATMPARAAVVAGTLRPPHFTACCGPKSGVLESMSP